MQNTIKPRTHLTADPPCRGSEWLTRTEILITVDRVEGGMVYHHCVIERGARKGERCKMECSETEWAESLRAGKLRPANDPAQARRTEDGNQTDG